MLELVCLYRSKLQKIDIGRNEYPFSIQPNLSADLLKRCNYILDKVEDLVKRGCTYEANRFLGIIQGYFICHNVYNSDDIDRHYE